MSYDELLLVCCYSLLQAGISTIISVALALPLAHFFAQYTFWGKKFFLSLLLFFCIMPTKLCALSVKLFYGLHGLPGIVTAHVLLNLPFACYLLYTAYQKIDWLTVWAAADLGASFRQQYKDVILPQIKPALLLTSLTIFLLCFSSFSIPRMLGTHYYHYTPDVLLFFANKLGDDQAVRWCFFLRLLVMIPLGLLYNYLLHTKAYAPTTHVSHTKKPIVFNVYCHGLKWLSYAVFILCILGGPLMALFVDALRHDVPSFLYNSFWSIDPLLKISISSVLRHSLAIAIVSSVGSLVLGSILAGFQLFVPSHYTRIIMHAVAILPLLVGNVASGMFCAEGKMIATDAPYTAIIISHLILHYPFVYRFIIMQLYAYPTQLTQLAQSSGALPHQVFRTILLPFVRNALSKAWSIAFGLSLIEVGAGAVVADNMPLTIPLAMRLYYAHGRLDGFLGLSFILLMMICTVSYVVGMYGHRLQDEIQY